MFAITLLLAFLRFAGVKASIFKSLAHVWVGLLLGAWALSLAIDPNWLHAYSPEPHTIPADVRALGMFSGELGWGLTVVEVICGVIAPLVRLVTSSK